VKTTGSLHEAVCLKLGCLSKKKQLTSGHYLELIVSLFSKGAQESKLLSLLVFCVGGCLNKGMVCYGLKSQLL